MMSCLPGLSETRKTTAFQLGNFLRSKKTWHSTGAPRSCFMLLLKLRSCDPEKQTRKAKNEIPTFLESDLLCTLDILCGIQNNTKHAYLSARRFFIFDRQSASVPSSTWTKSGVHSLLVSCENLDLPPSCGGQTLKGKHWCSTTQPHNHFPEWFSKCF